MKEKALALLRQYNQNEALVRHGLAVSGVMRHFAAEAGEDVDYWGAVGLLHDVDYEQFPDQHCVKAADILREAGYDDAFVHAVISHGHGIVVDAPPTLYMEKVLFATDELTGLIYAAALMRPSRSVSDIEVSSVKKKFKDKRFAASVDRDLILKGCEELGQDLDTVIEKCILGLRSVASEIGM